MFAKLTLRPLPARRLASPLHAVGAVAPTVAVRADPVSADERAEPKYAAIVIDANSGEVLYDKRADSPRYPASVTKVMTLYLTFEALSEGRLKLTDRVVISPRAAAQAPTKLGLPAGDSISVDEAIRAMTVKSANDVAVAMAEKLAGSESRFAALMTLRGQELGMRNSRFVNASGLPDSRQISTARDLAILSRATMRDFPQYYSYFSGQGLHLPRQLHQGPQPPADSMDGFDGLKTGYTNASGFNLAGSAVRDGRRLIAVVLGGSSTAWRDNNMEDLLLTGFDVLKRRSHGERTTIAANLYEDEPTGPIMRPSVEQGDGDQAGLKIVLTDNPAPAGPGEGLPHPARAQGQAQGDRRQAGPQEGQGRMGRAGRRVQVQVVGQGAADDGARPLRQVRGRRRIRGRRRGRRHVPRPVPRPDRRAARSACSAITAKRSPAWCCPRAKVGTQIEPGAPSFPSEASAQVPRRR
jgi:D-alanyl-D-alanine carboxypeptidase